jgi:hypothetical protein
MLKEPLKKEKKRKKKKLGSGALFFYLAKKYMKQELQIKAPW